MYQYNFNLSNTTPPEVVGMLKATGSRDPDILHAAMQDFRRTFAVQRVSGIIFMVVGVLGTFTVVLIPVSVPAAVFGWWYWKKGVRNLAIVQSAYESYLRPLGAGGATAVA